MICMPNPNEKKELLPHLIAWEVTRRCNMKCLHCRAAAQDRVYPNELTTEQCMALLDNIAGFARPIIILTGGEPMLRDDIYRIARYGHDLQLRMVMAPCGALVDDAAVRKMIDAGIQCISISLDGATAESHDGFRRIGGSFDAAVGATHAARRQGLAFQINTTITRHNLAELGDITTLAERLGAVTFNPFLLVPTGRGAALADEEISPEQYEQTLQWLSEQRGRTRMQLRVTCAPHYQRIIRQSDRASSICSRSSPGRSNSPGHSHGSGDGGHGAGCMGGKGFAFISHVGKVQICGFLEQGAGDVKANGLDFETIWKDSEFFRQIRDVDRYRGKCGYCEYRRVCGGCRARAYALSGDYMASEPYCVFEPSKKPLPEQPSGRCTNDRV